MRWRLALSLSSTLLIALGSATPGVALQNSQKKRATNSAKPADAATPSDKHSLESLTFTGNRRISHEKILQTTGLKIGQMVDRGDFDAARARLLATGAFESIGFDFQPSTSGTGFDGSFELVEVAQMFPYQFEDLPASDEVLRAVISKELPIFDAEIPATRPLLERCERALMQAVDGQVPVEAHMLATLHGGEPKIVFRLPGERPRISQVSFTGYDVVPLSKLAPTFAEAAIGTEFKESLVRALLDKTIRPLYEARGRIRVAFPKIIAEKSAEEGVDAVGVSITIDEGPEFKLGQMRYAAPKGENIQARDLEKLAELHSGELANFDEVKKAQDRIVHKFRGTGYLHASVKQERTVHDEEHTVDLLLTVEPGPQFMFGKLTVEGLDLIGEPAVRKMWGEREGKPFDPEFPDTFLKDVRDEGMFDNLGKTSSSTKVNEETKIVDVTLTFEGMKRDGGKGRSLRQPF